VTSLRLGDEWLDELAQASATNIRSALLTLGPDPVACITISSYQAGSRYCDSRFALSKHIFRF